MSSLYLESHIRSAFTMLPEAGRDCQEAAPRRYRYEGRLAKNAAIS